MPSWTAPYWNDEIAKFELDLLSASDALLLGRITYEEFSARWPERDNEEGFADSDDESIAGSDDIFWAPTSTAAPSSVRWAVRRRPCQPPVTDVFRMVCEDW